MKIYADESGNFSWSPPKPSVFVSLILLDRDESDVISNFRAWKQKNAVSLKTEIKGADQSNDELATFVSTVFLQDRVRPRLIAVGADTSVTKQETIEAVKAQVAEQFAEGGRMVEKINPENRTLIQAYSEMPGWIRNRSSANVLWISVLEELVRQTLQLAVIAYGDKEFDSEFSQIQFNIDRSFIKESRHEIFWKEWLRNGFTNRRHRANGFFRPKEWRDRQHPFLQQFSEGIFLNFNSLVQQGIQFRNSKNCEGVQLVDICAQIIARFLSKNEALKAFQLLLPHILPQEEAAIKMIHFDPKESLWTDSVENHVKIRTKLS